ncbi:MAG: RNA methyltransferase PUA domain-containing protein, partial [Actinomycetota bacterium]
MTDETLRRSSAHVFVDDIAHPVLAGDDAHHLSRVLRLRDGESDTCSDGRGRWRSCSWTAGGLTAIGDIIEVASPRVRLSVAI